MTYLPQGSEQVTPRVAAFGAVLAIMDPCRPPNPDTRALGGLGDPQ